MHFSRIYDQVFRGVLAIPGKAYWTCLCKYLIDKSFFEGRHIFIVGCGHSGTSVLLARLDNHKDVIAIVGESRFFQVDPMRRALLVRKWAKRWSAPSVLAEKTPIHVRYCEKIREIFPNARIVGICRDPRDVVASLYLRYSQDLDKAIRRWNKDNKALAASLTDGLVNYVIRYEDLVTDPERELVGLQLACGLEVQHGLSQVHEKKGFWYARVSQQGSEISGSSHEARRHMQINQPIFDGRGKYKQVLSKSQVFQVQRETQAVLTILNHSMGQS